VIPEEDLVTQELDIGDKAFSTVLNNYQNEIFIRSENVNHSILDKTNVCFEDVFHLSKNAEKLVGFSSTLFDGLILEYILKKENPLNSKIKFQEKTFGELFTERNTKVKHLDFVPEIYSVTNSGIQPREGNFTKKLSKSNQNYKVAFLGDMVFGLSRQIPNLDVIMEKVGAFSTAYSVFEPIDYRIGIIVGKLMRLKLMEQVDILKGGAREGRGLDKEKLLSKTFTVPDENSLGLLWFGEKKISK